MTSGRTKMIVTVKRGDDVEDVEIAVVGKVMKVSFNQNRKSSRPTWKEPPQEPAEERSYANTSSDYVPRYTGPEESEMTPAQIEIRDAILATRKRTGLSGPFGPWMAVPQIAQPAQALGSACRYGTSLSFRESELVILLTGAKAKSHTEFDIHVGEALTAGISMEIIEAIPRDDEFSLNAVQERVVPLLDNPREVAIVLFAAELLDSCSVCDETYESSKVVLDGKDSVLVEIVSICGYYTYVAYTLNAFRIPSKAKKPE